MSFCSETVFGMLEEACMLMLLLGAGLQRQAGDGLLGGHPNQPGERQAAGRASRQNRAREVLPPVHRGRIQ